MRTLGATVDEVAQEDGLTFWATVDALLPRVAELLEEPFEGVSVPVDVADGVVHGVKSAARSITTAGCASAYVTSYRRSSVATQICILGRRVG
jgi:hypothetical protein